MKEEGTSSLLQVWKENNSAKMLFIMFAILIILGVACFIFALFHRSL